MSRNPFDGFIDIDLSKIQQIDFDDEYTLYEKLSLSYDSNNGENKNICSLQRSNTRVPSQFYIFNKNTHFGKGDRNCWISGLFTFDDIFNNYYAERRIIDNVLHELYNNNNVLINGSIYSGKTTLLEIICIKLIEKDFLVLYTKEPVVYNDLMEIISRYKKNKLVIVVDNIYNSIELLDDTLFKSNLEIRFIFSSIPDRMNIEINEIVDRKRIQKIKAALNNFKIIPLEFTSQDAFDFFSKILAVYNLGTIMSPFSLDIIKILKYLEFYKYSKGDILIYTGLVKKFLFEQSAKHKELFIDLESEILEKWNKIKNNPILMKTALFFILEDSLEIKITSILTNADIISYNEIIDLIKKDILLEDQDGTFKTRHRKWSIEFIENILDNNIEKIRLINGLKQSIKEVISKTSIEQIKNVIRSCIELYVLNYVNASKKIINILEEHEYPHFTFDEKTILFNNIGEFYFAVGDLDNVIKINEKALLFGQSSEVWNHLGIAYSNIKEFDKATTAYENALKIDPTNDQILTNYGSLLMHKNLYVEAHQYFDKSLELNANNVDAWRFKAVTYRLEKKFKESMECCENALKIDPNHDESLIAKGELFFEWDEMDKDSAIQCFNKVIDLNRHGLTKQNFKKYEAALAYKLKIQIQLRDYESAITSCNETLQDFPNHPDYLKLKQKIENMHNNKDESISNKQ